jgi:hypothetical protein
MKRTLAAALMIALSFGALSLPKSASAQQESAGDVDRTRPACEQ